jgi:AAA ATPase-like protein
VLLERSDQLSALADALEPVSAGGGRRGVPFLGAEAGAGKTVLLQAFCDERRSSARILWGACDGLLTPGPLGPFFDVAEVTRVVEVRSSGFDWGDAALGAAGMLSLLGVAAGAVVVARRSRPTLS